MEFQKQKLLVALVVTSTLVVGCEVDSNLAGLSDREMRAKIQECKSAKSPAPAMIFACENYQRECEKRTEKAGYFVC
jgi:hypothetical protein